MNADESGDFHIGGFDCDRAEGVVRFHYRYAAGPAFTEVLDFAHPLPPGSSAAGKRFEAALQAISVMAGVSYYKACAPTHIVLDDSNQSDHQIECFRDLYFHGLGEFAYRNRLDLTTRLKFRRRGDPGADTAAHNAADEAAHKAAVDQPAPVAVPLERRAAVLIGGGKDSLVSVEVLRAAKEPLTLFSVSPKQPILDCARESGFPLVTVSRRLDPTLFELNASGALNGHVPITAVISFIAIAAAYVHGFDAVILSNERSANEGTIEFAGRVINHQFSKTASAEATIAEYTARFISPTLQYFSLLRPLSEVHIGQLFARTDRYDGVFTSCNRAFRLQSVEAGDRWCCTCPKCRFTFLILALAMPAERLLGIFGTNLLDDPGQLPGYEALVALEGHKPWECVGEVAESSAAVLMLFRDPFWRDCAVVRDLASRLTPLMPEPDYVWRALMTPSAAHAIPPRFERMLHAYIEAQ
jgi:hypothetical protein